MDHIKEMMKHESLQFILRKLEGECTDHPGVEEEGNLMVHLSGKVGHNWTTERASFRVVEFAERAVDTCPNATYIPANFIFDAPNHS